MKTVFLFASLSLALFSCKSKQAIHTITPMKTASTQFDPHSAAKRDAVVTHLHWQAKVDVELHMIFATATYDIQVQEHTHEIVLDTRDLNITKTWVDGKEVSFKLDEAKPYLGQALHIPVKPNSKKVSIEYSTSDHADALLWVNEGKPFCFHNRKPS